MILGRTLIHEAERQRGDPFPLHVPKETRAGEPLSRLLRSKGRRIAVGHSFVPEGWHPHPDDAVVMEPGTDGIGLAIAIIRHYRGLRKWELELKVGKNVTVQQTDKT